MKKHDLRRLVLQERGMFSLDEAKLKSKAVNETISSLAEWNDYKKVHIYLPIGDKSEIDTWPIVEWLLKNGYEVWVSYLPEDDKEDGFCQITQNTKYNVGRYGTPLPLGEVVKAVRPDVIIVPCVAADKGGNRLGYGLGWYDRFLASNPEATKIGLVYEQFLFEEIPHELHDQQLDIVVSEKQIIHTKCI